MRLRFFTVPVLDPTDAAREINRFLGQHRVLTVDRELVHLCDGAVWSVCVTDQDTPATEAKPRPRPLLVQVTGYRVTG